MELTSIIGQLIDTQYQTTLFADRALRQHEGHYLGNCPFHSTSTYPTLNIYKDTPRWYCSECEHAGTWFQYLERRQDLSAGEILDHLSQAIGYRIEDNKRTSLLTQIKLANLHECAHTFYHENLHSYDGKPSMEFLQRAGYSHSEIRRLQLGHYPGEDKVARYLKANGFTRKLIDKAGVLQAGSEEPFRIAIPVRDEAGLLSGFVYRRIGGTEPLYILSHSGIRDRLFNIHTARAAKSVLLTERYLDALLATVRGIDNVIATGGFILSDTQMNSLARMGISRLILALDSDRAGVKCANSIISRSLIRGDFRCSVALSEITYRMNNGFLSARGIDRLRSVHAYAQSGPKWQAEQLLDSLALESKTAVEQAKDTVLKYTSILENEEDIDQVLTLLQDRLGYRADELRKDLQQLTREKPSDSKAVATLAVPRVPQEAGLG